MRVPGAELPNGIGHEVTPSSILVESGQRDDETADTSPSTSRTSYLDVEDRQLQTYGVIIASVVFCVAVGWLAGPLLAGPMESLTGTPIENTSDLRPTGGVLGLLAGFFIGATCGWIIWSGR